MAIRHLLNLSRRSPKPPRLSRSSSQSAVATSDPSPPSPDVTIYDRLAESVKSKIKRLENPDPRFLRYASPHPTLADHTSLLSFPETKLTALPNGLRIATESNLAARTAAVGVWIDAGSRFETQEANGVANLMERIMVFEGTEKIENIGGSLNACTSREMSSCCVKVMDEDVTKGVDVLADTLQNSVFEEDRIDRVREAILRDMVEVEGHAEKVVFDHLHATAFQYTPLGRTVLGPAENLRKITKKNIEDYISTHYAAHRMVISAAGAVKHEDVVEQVKKLFIKLSSNPVTSSQLVLNEPAIFTGSEVRIVDDDMPLARFAIAFSGASWTDPDSIALMVMQYMLGSWNKNAGGGKHMGSDLLQTISINGIAESMMAFNTNYKDTGLFGVYAVAKPDCLDDLAYSIMYEMSKLCYRVSEADVTRACNQLKSSLLLHIDGTSLVAEDTGRQLITYGRRIPFAELFARINAVNANTVKRVANRFIFDRDLAIAAMGPIQGLPDYNWFRRRTYWLRY